MSVVQNPRPALVGIDGQTHEAAEGNMWGYAAHIPDWHWNGWAVPLFTHAECERVAAQARAWNDALASSGMSADSIEDMSCNWFTFDAERGVWLEHDPRAPGEPEICEPSHLPDGTPVYALGNGYCWQAVDTSAEIPTRARAVLS